MNDEMLKYPIFPSFEEGSLRPKKKCHATLNKGAAGQVRNLFQDRFDLPGRADFKVARHLLDRRGHPSSKEGQCGSWKFLRRIHSFFSWPVSTKVAICALLLLLAGCAEKSDSAGTRAFKLGITSGAQEFVDFVMEGHGFLDQVGLKADKVKSLSPANLHLMVAERKVDIGFGGFTTMATARSEGKDIIVIYGVFSPVNMVFVRKDSPIKTLSDLRGKKLGIFGGPSSTTFAFLAVIARNWYGIDLFHDAQLVTAPAPALAELLGKGDIDAALLGTVESIQTFAEDRYRVLADLSAEYKAHQGGRAPAHVTVATNEEFAKTHGDIVRDYLKAYKNALQYVRVHPEVWDEYAASIKIDDPAERALLRQKMEPNLVESWDSEQIALQNDYLKLVHNIIGDSVLKVVPSDLIRNDYTP